MENVSPALAEAIATWEAAEAAFRSAVVADPSNDHDKLFEAKEAAELALITHPCLTIDDVRAKATIAIRDGNVFDSLTNCNIDGEHVQMIFLRSILGEAVP
ncbi:hypothetical protein [Rhizobium sp.]|uniref:hypothetical protein n=1 Tax=Rhizobium sp. TaxID=391 RepID=UPI0028B0B3A5